MSFRQYGGINYAARNNIVKNNYSNANNLSVMTKVGQPSSIINFESDLSANIIYSDLTVDNLTVKYNSNHKGILTVSDINSTSGIMYITNDITEPTSTLRIISNGTNNYIQSGRTSETKSAADLHFTDMNDENRWMTIKSDGKVGIGFGKNDSPSYTLDVSGNFRVNTDALVNGLTVGKGSGSLATNTAIGYQALLNNGVGSNNTAIGNKALLNNVDGVSNTAIGDQALTNNKNGYYNIALGTGALLFTNSTGNIGIGINTLLYNDTGNYNVAIGSEAGTTYPPPNQIEPVGPKNCTKCTFIGAYSGNTTVGDFISSTAIGSESQITADHQITLGTSLETVYIPGKLTVDKDALVNGVTVGKGGGSLYSNTALGYNALTSNVSSESNVAIGYNALFTQKTSGTTDENGIYLYNGDNTAIGVAALYWTDGISGGGPNTRSGAWNTAVGLNALVYNTTGSYNTAIGLQAGCYFDSSEGNGGGPRTADRCTFLGAESRSSYTDPIQSTAIGYNSVITEDYQIMLGTSSETVQIPGDLRVSGLLTANSGCNLNDGDITFRNTTGNYNNNIRQIFFDNGSTDSAYIKFVSVSGDNSYLEIETIDDRVPIHFTVNGTSIQEYGRMTLNTNGLSINYEQSSPQSTYALDVNGKLKVVNDALINGLTVGRGGGNLDTNTAFGLNALKDNVSGFSNVAIGYNALANNTGPKYIVGGYDTDNTAVGHNALRDNTTGYWNTAVGLNALLSNVTGGYNTAIGLDAGNNYKGPTNCYKCTFIGSNTGTNNYDSDTSYSFSTAIGYNAQITDDNQIMLGTSSETVQIPGYLTVTGKCTAGSFDIYSDYRIKENVLSLVDDSSFIVDNLRPVTYKNILSGKQDMGFIAHELQEQYPFLVSGEKDGTEKQSVNYIGLIALLVKEIQELKQDIKILKTNL